MLVVGQVPVVDPRTSWCRVAELYSGPVEVAVGAWAPLVMAVAAVEGAVPPMVMLVKEAEAATTTNRTRVTPA
jgi:hypothetical protein